MEFRPCIDIHNGKVKQIVGSSLRDAGDQASGKFCLRAGCTVLCTDVSESGDLWRTYHFTECKRQPLL